MKIRIMAALMAVCVVICTACSQNKNGGSSGERRGQTAQSGVGVRQSSVVISDSVKQNATKTVTGTVQSIVGNEVTLLVTGEKSGGVAAAERTERAQRRSQGGEKALEMPQSTEFAEAEKSTEKPQRTEFSDAEKTRQGEKSAEGEMTAAAESSDSENAEEKKAQTAAVYLLPVGMSMGSKDYSSVTAGNTLKIYFGSHPDDGSEIITGVEVMSGRR